VNTARKPNKLINQTSPYLLQHADNPVNWYPWCEEAFKKAKSENKPIFLSIGYSTCHWCHVMEEESFEDEEVAEILNASFISIKVDKEERPDIDSVYMNVCQALTGGGGWPLTIIMTPEQKPFFAGTYFPKTSRYGRPGLIDLLDNIAGKWKESPELYSAGEEITVAISQSNLTSYQKKTPDRIPVEKAAKYLDRMFDDEYGGFGYPPKFPTPHNLMFLLRCHFLNLHQNSLHIVEKTLQQMYKGGIFDHVGYGFSRYSTDEKWLVPHFEKMLYDNALLSIVLLETAQVTGKQLYKDIAKKTLSYIESEMLSPEGGFYSAQDADSEGEEGRFYTFTPDEIESVLGKTDGEYFCRRFSVTKQGNFEGKNILNLIDNPDYHHDDPGIDRMLPLLREYRNKRTVLHKDDKILTSWNALMIIGFVKAYRVLFDDRYLNIAKRSLDFIYKNLTDNKGNLYISYREGIAKGDGLLDDYAFLCWALLEMYQATYNVQYLERSINLAKKVLELFPDQDGGFFMNSKNSEELIYRPKEQYDGAMPSGNSVFAYCLVRLAALTGDGKWQSAADSQLSFYYSAFNTNPSSYCFALMALMLKVYPAEEIVCVVEDKQHEFEAVSVFSKGFYPQTNIIIKTPENVDLLEKIAPFIKEYPLKNLPSYYVCENQTCSAPVHSLNEVLRRINS
jgi:uncharacterized protein YyaL (SSP411 family)